MTKNKEVDEKLLYKRVETPILQKLYKDSDKKYHLAAYVSSTRRDRDGDRFSKAVMDLWAETINKGKINLGQDHGHSWKDTLGVWKKAEVRQNPHGDDLTSPKHYLFADALLEDPDINKDVQLLIHKSDLGEQISVSIAANPTTKNWYELETEKDGSNTRVIKNAELLKIDTVGEPANVDARAIGVFLKHIRQKGRCVDKCEACYIEKDFNECILKSTGVRKIHKHFINGEVTKDCDCDCPKLPDNHRHTFYLEDGTQIYTTPPVFYAPQAEYNSVIVPEGVDPYREPNEVIVGDPRPNKPEPMEVKVVNGKSISSLVNENTNKIQMTKLSKEDQDILNKEHGCGDGEHYCADEGKCIPDEEEPEKSQLSPEVQKFIEAIKAIATTPAPQTGTDPNGTPAGGGLESIVQQALASMRTNPKMGDLQFNIPSATQMATPGQSGVNTAAQPQTPPTPQATLQPPIPTNVVQASPGNSGVATGAAPSAQGTPTAPDLANPTPIPPAQVQASAEPKVKKGKSLMADRKTMEEILKAREIVTPKHENPGEVLPYMIDTSKLEGEVKKAAEEYNRKVISLTATQIKQQYTPNDIAKMAEEGKLLTNLDENNNFPKVMKAYAKSEKNIDKKIIGSLLLTKAT